MKKLDEGQTVVCYVCHKEGHKSYECKVKNGGGEKKKEKKQTSKLSNTYTNKVDKKASTAQPNISTIVCTSSSEQLIGVALLFSLLVFRPEICSNASMIDERSSRSCRAGFMKITMSSA